MPLIPATMSSLIQAKAASLGIGGSKHPDFINAVSKATSQYLMSASTVTSTNFVTGPGSGTCTGKIVGVLPSAMSSLMLVRASSYGIGGRDTKKLFDAISFGVVQSLNAVSVQGVVTGGGPGTGVGKIFGLVPSALQSLIIANLSFRVIVGSRTAQLISAIAFGICNHIMSAGTVQNVCVGVFTPPPVGPVPIPAAPGTSRFA